MPVPLPSVGQPILRKGAQPWAGGLWGIVCLTQVVSVWGLSVFWEILLVDNFRGTFTFLHLCSAIGNNHSVQQISPLSSQQFCSMLFLWWLLLGGMDSSLCPNKSMNFSKALLCFHDSLRRNNTLRPTVFFHSVSQQVIRAPARTISYSSFADGNSNTSLGKLRPPW